jgi:hypothetical protein
MRKRSMSVMPSWRRGHCRLALSRGALAVLCVDVPRLGKARKTAPRVAQRLLPDVTMTAPDQLAAQIAAAIDEAGGSGLPVYATFSDELVRYFIVTPPDNSARMQDLRAAAGVRFQMLYGEPASAWQIAADWQAGASFLACAVSQRLHTALQLAVKTQRGCLVAAAPNFVAAWNRWRRRLAADAWLATLHGRMLTLGLVTGAARSARLAAVRNLVLPDDTPPLAWLQAQLTRAALLDNVAAPAVLHVHGTQIDAWQTSAATPGASASHAADDAGMTVRWCMTGNAAAPALASAPAPALTSASAASAGPSSAAASDASSPALAAVSPLAQTTALSALAQLAWGGAAP